MLAHRLTVFSPHRLILTVENSQIYLNQTTSGGPGTGSTPNFTSETTTSGANTGPTVPIDPDAICLPTQLCPPAENCNIPGLIDREDCGELASTPETCVASGCCWEPQPPGPIPDDPEEHWPAWCYYPA